MLKAPLCERFPPLRYHQQLLNTAATDLLGIFETGNPVEASGFIGERW